MLYTISLLKLSPEIQASFLPSQQIEIKKREGIVKSYIKNWFTELIYTSFYKEKTGGGIEKK
jgi:hypothetical protein